jgi:hypothetical protein
VKIVRTLTLLTVVVALTAALGASPAQAMTTYSNTGAFGSEGAGPGQFNPPGRLAVDRSSGTVFVIDRGAARIEVFTPNGDSAEFAGEFGGGTLVQPTGIAADSDTGDVYVSDAGAEKIFRFESSGGSYDVDASFASPVLGSGAGQLGTFAAPLAFDDGSDQLLVADPVNLLIDRFEVDGSLNSSFDGSSSGSSFASLEDLTVLPDGDVVVVDGARVERFEAGGGHAATLEGIPGDPDYVGYDSRSGKILVGHSGFIFEAALYRVDPATNQFVDSYRSEDESFNGQLTGIAADDTGRDYVGTVSVFGAFGLVRVEVFRAKVLPDLAIDQPTAVTSTAAHLSGSINPVGQPATRYRFEYRLDGASEWAGTPEVDVGEGGSPLGVEADIGGLVPNSSYQVRLVGINGDGDVATEALTFATATSAPNVVTGSGSDRTPTGARLNGTVTAFGLLSTYRFEYGPTTGYGQSVPVDFEGQAGASYSPRHVSQPVSGLVPGTVYHFRLVARNSVDTTYGDDATFTTPSVQPVRRFELVSPADKGGANVEAFPSFVATLDGNGLTYPTKNPIGTLSPAASPLSPRYFARRTSNGWVSIGLDPPQVSDTFAPRFYNTLGVSGDGSKAFVISGRALAPGAVEGDSNSYLVDTATGELTTVGTTPGLQYVSFSGFLNDAAPTFVGGTSDFDHFLFYGLNVNGCCSFLPDAPVGALYDFSGGELKLVSRLPDGTPTSSSGENNSVREERRISADGSRIFFKGGDGALYVRINGTTTKALSVSHRTGEPETPKPAEGHNAAADGETAIFVSRELTDDSEPGISTLYRVDIDSGELTVLAPSVGNLLAVSADGEYVHFSSSRDLGDGGIEGLENIYLWHNGDLQRVTTLSAGLAFFRASPNGRYFALASYENLTGYDPSSSAPGCNRFEEPGGACREVYRYEAATDSLACASCPSNGAPMSSAGFGLAKGEFNRHFPRNVLDNGEVLFDTEERLAAADVNSGRDVYSFDGTQASLISAGTADGDSQFAAASPDGRDIFFTTQQRLVGIDTDSAIDVYDARVGGGLKSQERQPAAPACSGDSCRAGVAPLPVPPPISSEAIAGTGKPKVRKRCGKKHRPKSGKRQGRCPKHHKSHSDRGSKR